MTTNLRIGARFPDVELPSHEGKPLRLSQLTRPGLLDQKLGFPEGYPLLILFYRGLLLPARHPA